MNRLWELRKPALRAAAQTVALLWLGWYAGQSVQAFTRADDASEGWSVLLATACHLIGFYAVWFTGKSGEVIRQRAADIQRDIEDYQKMTAGLDARMKELGIEIRYCEECNKRHPFVVEEFFTRHMRREKPKALN